MVKKQGLTVISILVPVFLLVACSGTTQEPTRMPTTFTITGETILGGSVRAAFALEGEELDSPGPTLTVHAGEPVSITFKNPGKSLQVAHNLMIVAEKSVDANPLWGAETELINYGEQETITFTPDTPGSYFYICSIETHMQDGMWGELIVEP